MNKRIFSLLMALALVLTFAPFAPAAVEAEAAVADPTGTWVCPFHKDAHDGTWTDLSTVDITSSAETLEGHYYVPAKGMEIAEQINWDETNKNCCIYLVGNLTSTSTTAAVFNVGYNVTLRLLGEGTVHGKSGVATLATGQLHLRHTVKLTADASTSNSIVKLTGKSSVVYMFENSQIDGSNGIRPVEMTAGTFNMGAASLATGNPTITGGKGDGGAVYMHTNSVNACNFNMYCGTINASNAGGTRGAAIYMKEDTVTGVDASTIPAPVFTMGQDGQTTNATINGCDNTNGYTNGGAAQIADGTFTMYDGATINGGYSKGTGAATGGGALYANSSTGVTVHMYKGSKISGGTTAGSPGGALYIGGTTNFIMEEGAVIENGRLEATTTTNNYGGNVYLCGSAVFTMNGGLISGGYTNYQGGNVKTVGTSQFIMNGGVITGGEAKNNGGNVHYGASGTGKFQMNGGIIKDGVSAVYGGNIMAHNGGVDINGGLISGGYGKSGGGNLYCYSGTTTVDDAVLLANANNGGTQNVNVRSNNATLKLTNAQLLKTVSTGINLYVQGGGTSYVEVYGSTYIPQIYMQQTTSAATGNVKIGADFNGYVLFREVDPNNSSKGWTYTGGESLQGVTADAAYAGAGTIVAKDVDTVDWLTEKDDSDNLIYVTESIEGTGVFAAFVNHYVGKELSNSNYVTYWYMDVDQALAAYKTMMADNVYLGLQNAEGAELDFTDVTDPIKVNLGGNAITSVTAPEAVELKVWDASDGQGSVGTITGGTMPTVTVTVAGEYYLHETDAETGEYKSYKVTVNAKAFLRTSAETLAFQGKFAVNTAVADQVTEIGLKLYKADGTLMETVAYTDQYAFTALALNDLHTDGAYYAARVALASEGDANNWWAEDIVVTAYITVDGVTYESATITANFQEAVLANLENLYVQEMINNAEAGRFDFISAE